MHIWWVCTWVMFHNYTPHICWPVRYTFGRNDCSSSSSSSHRRILPHGSLIPQQSEFLHIRASLHSRNIWVEWWQRQRRKKPLFLAIDDHHGENAKFGPGNVFRSLKKNFKGENIVVSRWPGLSPVNKWGAVPEKIMKWTCVAVWGRVVKIN